MITTFRARRPRAAAVVALAVLSLAFAACIPPRGTPPPLSTTTTTAPHIIATLASPTPPVPLTQEGSTTTYAGDFTIDVENRTGAPIDLATGRLVLVTTPSGTTIRITDTVGNGCYVSTPDGSTCTIHARLSWVQSGGSGVTSTLVIRVETNGFSDDFDLPVVTAASGNQTT